MPTWDDIPSADSAPVTSTPGDSAPQEKSKEEKWAGLPGVGRALDGVYRQARSQSTGDDFSKTLLLSDRTKWPSPLVEKMTNEAGIVAEKPDFEKISREAPTLAWAMTNRDFMRLAYDDGPALTAVEKTLRPFVASTWDYAGGATQGLSQYLKDSVDLYLGISTLRNQGKKLGKALYQMAPSESAAGLPQASPSTEQALNPALALPAAGVGMGSFIRDAAKEVDIPEDQREWYSDLAAAVGQMGGQAAVSYLNPLAGAASFAGYGYQSGYERAIQSGKSEEMAKAAGTLSAAVEGVTEKLGIDGLMRVVPPKVRQGVFRFLADTVTSGGIEFTQELFANYGQNAIDKYMLGQEKDVFTLPGSEELSAGGAAAILRAVVIGMSRGRATMTTQELADERTQFFSDLQEKVTSSKLFQRHKDTFTSYAQSVLEESESATAYIDGRGLGVYLETLPEDQRADLVEKLGGARAVREAIDFGQDVTLPLGQFLQLADTPHYDALTADTRLRMADLTVRELQAAQTNLEARADAILAEQDAEDLMAQSADRVAAEVESQLVSAGQIPAVAKTNAALHRANAIVLASELNITPEQVYEKFGLKISSELAGGESGQVFDQNGQLRTDTPEFQSWFGESKAVDEAGAPLTAYHGTASAFSSFDPAKATDAEGRRVEMGWGAGKFYFTDSPAAASDSAGYSQVLGKGDAPNVMPVYLSIQNPIEAGDYMSRVEAAQAQGLDRDAAIAQVDQEVRAEGFDGIVDSTSGGMAVFDPAQIKSVFNEGTWDPFNDNVLKQEGRDANRTNEAENQADAAGQPGPLAGKPEQRGGGETRVRSQPYQGREADGSLQGLPRQVGRHTASAWAPAQEVARKYMEDAGLPYYPPSSFSKVDAERAGRIAQAFEEMEHNPQDPQVRMAYQALVDETVAQYEAALAAGLTVEFIRPGQEDPYGGSPWEMTKDVKERNHMWVFSTREGFGSDEAFDPQDNPLLAETEFEISGEKALVNDLFRVVHDYFGHVKEGVGFRADGEENAWRAHSAMFSPMAQRALTTETRGQNSWVNFGPYAEANRTASPEDTHYADQKIGLLPLWASEEGRSDRVVPYSIQERGYVRGDGLVPLTHLSSAAGLKELDPTRYGTGVRGRERSRTSSPRSFFYLPGATIEPVVKTAAPHRYLAQVSPAYLYDAEADPLGFVQAAREREAGKEVYQKNPGLTVTVDQAAVEEELKAAGFKGYWSSKPFPAVVMFDATPVQEVTGVPQENPAVAGWDEFGSTEDPGKGTRLYQGPREKAQRDGLGLYSQVEQTVLDMNIPGWKPNKKDKEAGRDPAAKGADIWQKVKSSPGVKAEELQWMGLEGFLLAGDRFTREQVLAFVRENGVQVKEVIGDTPFYEAGEETLTWDEEVNDDPSAWEHIADDLVEEWGHNPLHYSHIFDLEQWVADNPDRVVGYYLGRVSEEQKATLAGIEDPEDALYYLEEEGVLDPSDFTEDRDVVEAVREGAQGAAYAQYMDDPEYILTAAGEEGTIYEDGVPLTIKGREEWGWFFNGDDYPDLESARGAAEEYVRDRGYIRGPVDEEDPGTARWHEYVMDGASSNYREVKLTLPWVDGSFVYDTHFYDENIVAFLRVTDRTLPVGPLAEVDRIAHPTEIDYENPEAPSSLFIVSKGKTVGEAILTEDAEWMGQALRRYGELTPEQRRSVYEEGWLAHRRQALRDAQPKLVETYFIEELQSDWHQQGRRLGYEVTDPAEREALVEEGLELNDQIERMAGEMIPALTEELLHTDKGQWSEDKETGIIQHWTLGENGEVADQVSAYPSALNGTGEQLRQTLSRRLAQRLVASHPEIRRLRRRQEEINGLLGSEIPNAPFKGDAWLGLALKRALVQAAESGKQAIAWPDSAAMADRWSDAYLTLYETQYDKKMPSLVKKLTKQKAELVSEAGNRHGYWIVEIPPELRAKIREEGLTLFQGAKERGQIFFPQNFPEQAAEIQLSPNADLSTFLHETGHFFLQSRIELIRSGEATEALQKDMDTLLAWMGVESVDQIGVPQHEQFARGFEAYLREGKAPSIELQTVFARFRSWLLQVYKNLMDLRVQLTPEVTEVMDRMLATQEALEANEIYRGMGDLFPSQEEAGLSDPEYQEYIAALEDARHHAIEDLDRQQFAELRKELNEEYTQTKAKVTEEVKAELAQDPGHQAKEFLTHGRLPGRDTLPEGMTALKLSPNAVKEMYDGEIPRGLPQGKYSPIARDGEGVHPDVVAELFGFDSGSALMEDMLSRPSYTEAVKAKVEFRMASEYADLRFDPASMADAAMEAAANKRQERVLLIELRALERKAGMQPTVKQALRLAAFRKVGQTPVKALTPNSYLQAMLRAGREATKAAAEKRYEDAATAKRQQVFNELMWRESRRAKEEAEKGRRYLRKFEKPGTRKNLARDYLDQIDTVLESVRLKPISKDELSERARLSDWIKSQEDQGLEVVFEPEFIQELSRKPFDAYTMEELRGLIDAIKNIEHLGRLKQRLLVNQEKRDFNETVEKMVAEAHSNATVKDIPVDQPRGAWGRVKRFGEAFWAHHLKVEFMLEMLDGHRGGLWQEAIFQPLADAETREADMLNQANEELKALWEGVDAKTRRAWNTQAKHIPELGRSFTKNELYAIALNMGNAGNIEALTKGEGWTRSQVMAVLNRELTDADWKRVQGVWDFVDSFWPQIEEIQKRLTGVAPAKVEALGFQTEGGRAMRGGYYPLKYDPERSSLTLKRDEAQNVKELYGGNALRPSTRKGHTKERVGSGGQKVLLNLGVLNNHVSNVIHDITHREAVLQADRLFQDERIAQVIRGTAGREAYKMLRPWLTSIANQTRIMQDPFEQVVGLARKNTTMVNMGWKLTTAIVQPLGYLQSVELLGAKQALKGLTQFYGSPEKVKRNVEWIFDKSAMMRNRSKSFDRDVRDAIKSIEGEGPKARLERTYLSHIGFFDLMVSMPTWMGAYDQALGEGRTDKQAVDFADKMVRMSQSAGNAKDLAAIQGGSEYKRLFTMFYSYFNVLHNLLRRRARIATREGLTAKSITESTMSMLYLVVLPAVLSEMIVGRWPDDDDDDPWMTMARTVVTYPLATVVGVRDLANAAVSGYGYSLTPMADAGSAVLRGAKGPFDGDINETDAKYLTMTAGYIFGLPSRQLWITGSNLYDLADGKKLNWAELMMLKEHRED